MALPPDGLLADPDRLAIWLKVPADDPKLLEALRAASARFTGQVHHPVRLVTGDTITVYGTGSDRLLLPAAPIVAVTEVLVDQVAVTDYRVRKDAGVLRRWGGCGIWPDWSEVTVTLDHGHDPVPEDVQEVVVDQARAIYRVLPGVQSVQAGGESITYGAQAAVGVSEQWTAAVLRYRLDRGDRA